MKSYQKIGLLILSYALLILAGGHWFIFNTSAWWDAVALIVVLINGIILWKPQFQFSKGTRKWQKNWQKWIGVIICGFLLVVMNWGVRKGEYRWDVTRAAQHTLSDFTRQTIGALNQPIEITIFYVGIPPRYLEDMLKEYQRIGGGKISTAIVDPLVNLGYAAQFGQQISSSEKLVIVKSTTQRRDIDIKEEALTEEALTNAIIRVTRAAKEICFLSGHQEFNPEKKGEGGYGQFKQLLNDNGFDGKSLLLADEKTEVPQSCAVLVVAGPKSFLSAYEDAAIDRYLRLGGDALILVEGVVVSTADVPLTKEQLELNPSLNELLNLWGVNVGKDVVIDLKSHASGDVGSPATRRYMPHPGIVKGLDYVFFIRPRSLLPVKPSRQGIRTVPLMVTMSDKESWAERNRYLDTKFTEVEDLAGPVPLGFVVWEPKKPEELKKKSDTRMVVITDADFLSDLYIKFYSNAQLGMNLINWLAETDYQVFVNKGKVDVPRLDLTSQQKRIVIVILFAVPVFILCLAFAGALMRNR